MHSTTNLILGNVAQATYSCTDGLYLKLTVNSTSANVSYKILMYIKVF